MRLTDVTIQAVKYGVASVHHWVDDLSTWRHLYIGKSAVHTYMLGPRYLNQGAHVLLEKRKGHHILQAEISYT